MPSISLLGLYMIRPIFLLARSRAEVEPIFRGRIHFYGISHWKACQDVQGVVSMTGKAPMADIMHLPNTVGIASYIKESNETTPKPTHASTSPLRRGTDLLTKHA